MSVHSSPSRRAGSVSAHGTGAAASRAGDGMGAAVTVRLLHGDCCYAILIDLDDRNLPMARGRITADAPLFTQIEAAA